MYTKTSWQTAFAVVVGHPVVRNRKRYRSFFSGCMQQAPHRCIAYHTGLQRWVAW